MRRANESCPQRSLIHLFFLPEWLPCNAEVTRDGSMGFILSDKLSCIVGFVNLLSESSTEVPALLSCAVLARQALELLENCLPKPLCTVHFVA